MKYLNILKTLFVAGCIATSGASIAQTAHPLAFPATATGNPNNYYANYVGLRFLVDSPTSIAGPKIFTTAYAAGSTSSWGGAPTTMIDSTVIIGPLADSNCCTGYPANYFAGKIALIWRGTCEFGCKAQAAQTAGAIAVVLVNNVSGGPVGMAAGSCGAAVTIPVFMIGLDDGTAIVNELNVGHHVTMTIDLNWNSGHSHDLGIVPEGVSIAANSAVPYTQLNAHPAAYKGIDGAYVANFGNSTETNVKVKGSLSFTPTGGSSSMVYADSVSLASFPTIDSIWAMFAPQYDVPTVSGTGRFDLTYSVSADSADGFYGDNSSTVSFYATDSLYSKGRYDFANNRPYCALYTGSGGTDPYIWGVPYYIAHGGDAFDSVQFSISNGPGIITSAALNVYVFKWVDGSGAIAADSFYENDELALVGMGTKLFGPTDSSFQFFTTYISGDTLSDNNYMPVLTQDNSWYVVAAEIQSGTALGLDGVIDGYPRAFGRKHFPANNYPEYYNPIWFGDRYTSTNAQINVPSGAWYPWSFDGTGSYTIDSVVYSTQEGLIPALPMTTTSHFTVGVKDVHNDLVSMNVFPNPAKDYVNVQLNMQTASKTVTYTIIDNSARVVSKETRSNVLNDVYTFNTSSLPAGNYYMVVNTDTQHGFHKFTVLK